MHKIGVLYPQGNIVLEQELGALRPPDVEFRFLAFEYPTEDGDFCQIFPSACRSQPPPRMQGKHDDVPSQGRTADIDGKLCLSQRVVARTFDRQITKLKFRAAILNRFSKMGTPVTLRIA